jgi:DnaD/phage-associated family protein
VKEAKKPPEFSSKQGRGVHLPDAFFAEVLPHIDTLTEVKTTLHIWWLLRSGKRYPHGITLREILKDEVLLRGLEETGHPAKERIKEGLDSALKRGTLLRVCGDSGEEDRIFLNDEEGIWRAGRIGPQKVVSDEKDSHSPPEGGDRPNIFLLYEQNIGLLQPLIADELKEAENSYPPSWVEEAFRIAAERNVRNWRYIRAILERWKLEGKDDGASWGDRGEDRRRYIEGEFADFIEH